MGYFSNYLECSKTCISVTPTTTTSTTINNIGETTTTTTTTTTEPASVSYSCDIIAFN